MTLFEFHKGLLLLDNDDHHISYNSALSLNTGEIASDSATKCFCNQDTIP